MTNDDKRKDDEFSQWLAEQRIGFGIRPTAERMLQSPDSLTAAQRAWLRSFIARWR